MIDRMIELTVVMFILGLFYLFIVDPIYGSVIGIGEPLLQMMWEADNRFGWSANIRSWIFIIFISSTLFIYMRIKPRLTGEDPDEYWSMDLDDDND